MRIDALRIDDFGCFRNARLDDLDDGLVVIGGPQRAGKTTFMRALRQLPNGVGRGGGIPPATDEYRLDLEITHDERRYRYLLNGHAKPSVSPIGDGPAIGSEDVFGPVTERQYGNVYTISLDELRRLPPGIDDPEDLARVLLGGAYGDIATIPEVRETFRKRAYDIGLKRGAPTAKTSELHEPYRTIRAGIEARREANAQVAEHESVTGTLEELRSELSATEATLSRTRRKRDRLNVLEELFEPLRRMETLDAALADADPAAIDAFPTHLADRLDHFAERFEAAVVERDEAREEFERGGALGASDDYYEWLLENESRIDGFARTHALWSKTGDDLLDRDGKLETRRAEIESEIASLHRGWEPSFSHVDGIETSVVDTSRVDELVSTLDGLEAERDELADGLRTDRSRKEALESRLARMEEREDGTREIAVPKRKPAVVAAVAVLAGSGVGVLTSPVVGVVVGLAVLAVGTYAVDSTITVETTVETDPYRETKGRVTTLEGEIRAAEDSLERVTRDIEETRAELDELATDLRLPAALPPSEVGRFYERCVELAAEIESHRRKRDRWRNETAELAADLDAAATLLEEVTAVSWSPDAPLEGASDLLSSLDAAATDLELARDLRRATREREDRLADVDSVLTAWDPQRSVAPSAAADRVHERIEAFADERRRVTELAETMERYESLETRVTTRLAGQSAREAFEPIREDDESWTAVVRRVAEGYADTDAVANGIRETKSRIGELETRRDDLRERRLELETRRDELASEDDLREARARIDEGRVEFERLGERYAENRIAERMVRTLHERLMADVVDSLVDDAGDIFATITGEYEGIELAGDVQELAFEALREGEPNHGVGELSRATAEQLFLAVRFARIRQTDAELPVVIDDAATNFDPDHASRVFRVVDELTSTHQVFFLTCHPECLRVATSHDRSAQLWALEDGRFSGTNDADALERRLSTE